MITDFSFFDLHNFSSVLLIGVALTLSILGYIGNININSDGGSVNINGANVEMETIKELTEKVDGDGASSLSITNPVGDVSIKPSEDSFITLKKVLKVPKSTSDDEKSQLLESFSKNYIKKSSDNADVLVPHMSVMGVMSVTVDLELMVPKHFSVKHNPGVNSISVEEIDGSVVLQNNVGNINLARLGGPVNAHTNSGSINAMDLKEPRSITVNAGNIMISSFDLPDGDLNIVSQVGKVELDIKAVAPSSNCVVKSSTGSVLLVIDRSLNVSLDVSTSMGSLDIDPAIQSVQKGQSFMGGAITATINHPGGKLSASSNTGSIVVKLK